MRRLFSSSIVDNVAGGHWIGGMRQLITSWFDAVNVVLLEAASRPGT